MQTLCLKMFRKIQLTKESSEIKFKNTFQDFISKQQLKIKFYFKKKHVKLKKFYFRKNNTEIGLMNLLHINQKLLNSQKMAHKKKIRKDQKYKIFGGGCGQTKFQIQNPQQISISQKKGKLEDRFIQKYEYFTNKKKILEYIESEMQGGMQVDIIKCLKSSDIHIRSNILLYKPKLMKLIDTYLTYVLSGSSLKEVLKQNEIKDLGLLIKDLKESFEMESQDQPCCDLIFYFEVLHRFNSIRIGKDEQNKNQLIKAVEFITNIVQLGAGVFKTVGGNFMEGIDLALKGTQFLLNTYQQSQSNKLFSYFLDIWVKKTVQFQDRVWDLTLFEEIQFYITIFNELCSKKDFETDLVLLTLIKIDYYFSLALEEGESLKTLSQKLPLNCELIKVFIPMLIQKNNQESIYSKMESFLKFTVQNQTFRFLTISILLKYNKIISDTNDFSGYKENILVYLCYKYLCEKNKSVKLAFETNRQFVENFNSKIQQAEFQNKIIQLSNERSKDLKTLLDLEGYEEKIDNSQDIERMIANILIDKWERDVKKRQSDDITHKDDVLLEVKDLYIQQSITYLQGNKIIQEKLLSKPSLTQISEERQNTQRSNALQEILDNFLQGSNVQTKENPNINIPITEEQNKCKILGILAEGGTGKSMFIKKLEIHLIQSANSNSEKENFIPLLIKCNSLDPISPSIENYLLTQGVNQQQISSIKGSDRFKVILLDGYDEFAGEYFRVYEQLNLNKWKNTKIIVTSRKEKLELSDACAKFSLDGENGLRDENSFCIVKLEEFTHQDILEYCKMYFRQYRTKEECFDQQQYQNDIDVMIDCLKNRSLEGLLYLPINLYLFTRMIVQVKDKTEIQKIKENISDQIGIQEIFFNEQFKREAQDFLQTQIKELSKKKSDLSQLIINSYFEYFQSISMKMFLNKGIPQITNFLQIRKDKIQFKLSKQVENKLSEKEKNDLLQKIIYYVNSKIITRSKEEIAINFTHKAENKHHLIEFKHKSLFEYFAARAMKYDFDIHGENIYKLTIEQLKEFNINKKSIMNAGQNQSEQQILIKLYKMIKKEIESDTFYSTYYIEEIEQNSRYIQYLKKSTIKKNTETSLIDIGASNILSAMFCSNFTYSKLELNFCSFSKLYASRQKSDLINFNTCNLQNSFLKNLCNINYDSCNTQHATFDSYQKVFDTQNIFSFNQVIWNKRNELFTVTQPGFINAFKVENQNILLQKSKQLSQTPLSQILAIDNDTVLVSSKYSLLQIDSCSFDLLESYKFKYKISSMTLIKENILVILENKTTFHGSFKDGFKKINIIGSGCIYNEPKQILLVYSQGDFSLFKVDEKFKLINTIQGHTYPILSVAFSQDGKYLATGSDDKTCKIWNVEKGFELINTIQGHTKTIFSVAFSADGKNLATGSMDKTCKIWNVEKGFELINTIQEHTSDINSVTFSADGKYFATGSDDNTCKIWNAEKDFELINTIQGHNNPILSVAFSADGKYLATSSDDDDNICKIWNAEKGFELLNTIQGHTAPICSVAFSEDGKYLATGSRDETCKIWNARKDFELINTIQGHTFFINSVAFSADGKYLATGSRDKTCKIWNAEKDFELINTIQGHTSDINSVAFSADGKFLATGSKDDTCKIWNAKKDFELINTILCLTDYIHSVAFSADGKYLATGSSDKTCKIWNAEKGFELIKTIQDHKKTIFSVAFSVDGKFLVTGSCDNTCKIWNTEKGFELINTIQGHKHHICSVAFSADGKYLATGSWDKTFKIWNAEKGFELINTIQGHTYPIFSVAISADGKYLSTGSSDNTCKIWNTEKGFELIKTIQGHTDLIFSVAFSADGKYLATGSMDKTCKIWNAEKGFELINTIQDHTQYIFSVAFSADGKNLATGSMDSTCKIWNAGKGFELINTIKGHTSDINSVAFSVDGKYLATGSRDNTCKIWNAEKDFELINTIQGHTDPILSVAFSADGKYLATSSDDDNNTCKIWNAEKGFELLNTIQGHTAPICSVAFSEDGKYLTTGSDDKTCKIWNARKDFELINTIQGHTDLILSVAFSADGKYLVTGSRDNTCKIWNAEKGFQLINKIQDRTDPIFSVAFSADGKYICVKNSQCYKIYELQSFKIIYEQVQNNYLELLEKYQFEFNGNDDSFKKMRIFENMYIL